MWWRLTKAIILSWFVGVLCGAVLVVVFERHDRAPPTVAADDQPSRPSNAALPDTNAR
jgi:xanthine/CO dehydrogenase XdhC/CoxF family maturation factor